MSTDPDGLELRARALEQLPSASLITDAEQRILFANPAFLALTGRSMEELRGRNCRMLQGPGTDPGTVADIRDALTSGHGFRGRVLNYRSDGRPFWNLLCINPIRRADGAITHFVSAQLDVTTEMDERRADEENRRTAEVLVGLAQRLTPGVDAVAVAQVIAEHVQALGFDSAVAGLVDEQGLFSVAGVSGFGDLTDAVRRYVVTPDESPELAQMLRQPRLRFVSTASSAWARRALAEFGNEALVAVPVPSARGVRALLLGFWAGSPVPDAVPPLLHERFTGMAALTATALANVDLVSRVRAAADRDPLTGVASRAMLDRRLRATLTDRPPGCRVALLYADVDRFKRVNDALGHTGGDEVLRELGRRMLSVAGPGDTVARPGGDEFVLLLPCVSDEAELEAFLVRLQQRLREPLTIGGRTIFRTVSVGTAIDDGPSPDPVEEQAEALVSAADAAMYRAKEDRRSPQLADTGFDLLQLDADLHLALQRQEIVAHFQAQYDCRSGQLSGFEALARWMHPRYGVIPPSVFIPLAEDDELIHELGDQVLRQACSFAERLTGSAGLLIQVNVSIRQLSQAGFAARAAQILAESRTASWELAFELTESVLMTNRALVQRELATLRESGIGVAIDDFGSGYSSLSQLQHLAATEMKIDRAFVRRTDAVGATVVGAIVNLGHSLGLEVVAEGVETEDQLELARELGCDRAQGFLLAHPEPAETALSAPRTIAQAREEQRRRGTGVSHDGEPLDRR